MTKFFASASLIALLAATPALAQTKTDMTKDKPTATETQAKDANSDMNKSDSAATTKMDNHNDAAKAAVTGKQWRASKLIGHVVYSAKNENIGEINDLIVSADGKISHVILGVGGFLGLGERNVSVAMSDLNFAWDNDKDLKITGDFTKESLGAMPAWTAKEWDAENAKR
ncbi:MAG: PRC-barrel domain-containing protein [Hyphomicrobiales bacterium]|nr:PRC-barrel domain-containing protein [Hyphomicrobiales bacterium]